LGSEIRNGKNSDPGSGINIPDPQHCLFARFLHEPTASDAYVGCALFSNIFHIFKTETGDWAAEKVIDVLPKKVQ
jgi:hypothetical protein